MVTKDCHTGDAKTDALFNHGINEFIFCNRALITINSNYIDLH